jgi:hypothetical protein
MYESGPDPYCYPGSSVLKNRLDLRVSWLASSRFSVLLMLSISFALCSMSASPSLPSRSSAACSFAQA